jgi:HDOD domain-containing protein
VLEKRVFEFGTARGAVIPGPLSPVDLMRDPAGDLVRDLPDVPVLSETLLLMELKSRDRAVDLTEISQLVLGDLGAVIQIMRLAGSEDFSVESRPTRIEDCISGLGVQACIEAMSRQTIKRRNRPAAIVETWTHAQTVAENCRSLAEENIVAVNPDEAFLVGLFHTIGSLPEVLGWEWTTPISSDPDLAGLRMADAWSLPQCVVDYFSEPQSLSKPGRWRDIVHRAHRQGSLRVREEALDERRPVPNISSAWLQLVAH